MTPAISWLFAINLYVWLFFFTVLVMNGDEFFLYITNKVGAYASGAALFAILLVTSVYVNIAWFLVKFFDLIINKVIPYGTIAFVVAVVILIVLMIAFPPFAQFVIALPAKITNGGAAGRVVKEGMGEVEKLRHEREVAESFSEGAGI